MPSFRKCVAALRKRAVRHFFRMVKKIPYVQRKIEEELSKAREGIRESMDKAVSGAEYVQRLPAEGLSEVSRTWVTQPELGWLFGWLLSVPATC